MYGTLHCPHMLTCEPVLQLSDNLGAIDVLPKLTPEVLEEIENIVQSKPDPLPTYR